MSIKPYFESKHCTLYHGDCLEIMPELAAGSVDLILCDLPYGTTNCSWDTVIPFEPLWECYWRVGKGNAAVVLTGSQPFASCLVLSNVDNFRSEWIWNKISGANFFNLRNRPLKTQEQVLVFCRKADFTFNPMRISRTEKSLQRDPVGSTGGRRIYSRVVEHYGSSRSEFLKLSPDGKKHPIDIITFGVRSDRNNATKHPTQKPVALMEYLINTYSNEGETVLDNCFGSGTTGVACCKTNRQFIGIEMEEKYCEVAAKRIERAEIDAAQNLFLEPEPVIPEKQMELTI